MISAGGLAPSGGNAQPWLVDVSESSMRVSFNPNRTGTFLDVGNIASAFALGCFIENLSIAASKIGLIYETHVTFQHDMEVRVSFTDRRKPTIEDMVLYKALLKRKTNRKISDGSLVEKETIDVFRNIVSFSDHHISLCTASAYDQKERVAYALGKADGVRVMHDELFEQMMGEFRWSKQEAQRTRDGIDMNTLELPKNLRKLLKLLRTYPIARSILPVAVHEHLARPLLLGSSHICCIVSRYPATQEMMFYAGRALERIWLEATRRGVWLHPWSVLPFFLARIETFGGVGFTKKEKETIISANEHLGSVFNISPFHPLFVFRISRGQDSSARSLRIPWREYTQFS